MWNTKRIYEELNTIVTLGGKLKVDEPQNSIRIVFHEYLRLKISAGRHVMTIVLNENLTHWHHNDAEEFIRDIREIAGGDVVFIERMNPVYRFFCNPVRILDKAAFEKKKAKYLSRKKLRIYMGTGIMKRDC